MIVWNFPICEKKEAQIEVERTIVRKERVKNTRNKTQRENEGAKKGGKKNGFNCRRRKNGRVVGKSRDKVS
ncbi:hypothetical protein WN51_04597 [Melipona quadrifasciata]|uniref:Uncharacterized protein n=1 Tax=Melipona quadrifasciata TaxID=166423 RepID=A0A0M8ZS83_9HYME|nr:hypothetical protein WN51_04597 [Melipona quadrifasciata]